MVAKIIKFMDSFHIYVTYVLFVIHFILIYLLNATWAQIHMDLFFVSDVILFWSCLPHYTAM